MALYHKIAILEQSDIVYQGIRYVVRASELSHEIIRVDSLEELLGIDDCKISIDLLIVNPLVLQNKEKEIAKLKKKNPNIRLLAMVSSLMESQYTEDFSGSFTIIDTAQQIISTITKLIERKLDDEDSESLSEREVEILIKVIHGKTNKEIAQSLNISIHTVITHRKNITRKTNVKSQSGLAIYAISKNIVSINDF